MAYNPYYNYNKKMEKTARIEKEKQKRIDLASKTICDGIIVERVSSVQMKKMIQNSRGQGLCFTNPCIGTPDMCLTEKRESIEERMAHGEGVDKQYYYK